MIVVDASVAADLVLGTERSDAALALARAIESGEPLAAPQLLDIEVAQTLRRLCLRGELPAEAATQGIIDLLDLGIERYSHGGLVLRAFQLRHNVTVYDGVYLALAEAVDAPLLTGDAALADVPGCDAIVEVLSTAPR